ncbi:MAG: ABC transporter substrate-binding protein [Sandaracinaceae bacterium]|nr:ABC transporter substrate-binding protein [Sandaracinaceae bacterium]
MLEVVDALGRAIALSRPATRVVSLVPSETLSVVDLAGLDRLIGRTTYCVEPRGVIESIPTCGGTKNIDVDKIIALAPDLVLANQEENSKKEVLKLIEAGVPVHVSFPQTLGESRAYLSTLARLLGVNEDAPALREVDDATKHARLHARVDRVSVFVPIWMDPLMTFDGRTFASSILAAVGADNVFADRKRRYPLAADIGQAHALSEEQVADRDTRYPRVTLSEIETRAPQAVLLPDEPHPFTPADEAVFSGLRIPAARRAQVIQLDGKDLFWYGTRVTIGLPRLCAQITALSNAP